MTDPEGYAREQAEAAIDAEFNALLEHASPEQVKTLTDLKAQRLAELEPAE